MIIAKLCNEQMVELKRSTYFLPTKQYRQLSIMLTMCREPDLRQQEIAEQVNMSGAMVNGYIKQLNEAGFIKIEKKNKRDFEYRLTELGRRQLMDHLMACSAEIVQFYSMAKEELIQRLDDIFVDGQPAKVILYGGSETARLVVSSLERFSAVKIMAIVDSDSQKWGCSIGGFAIQNPDILSKINPDWIIIASFAKQDDIYESLQIKHNVSARILKLSSL